MKNSVKNSLAVIVMMISFVLVFTACDPGGSGVPQQEPFNVTDEEGGTTLAEKLAWVKENAKSNFNYIIEVKANESFVPAGTDPDSELGPGYLSYAGKTNIGITLKGADEERTISLLSNGSLFTVESEVTLTLGDKITLKGKSANEVSLVIVNKDGTLVMNTGAKITGNTVYLFSSKSGGVHVNGGIFTMNNGKISGNGAQNSGGGGVCITSGTFTMKGGEISGNTASNNSGGAVYMTNGTFNMNGGKISGNSSTSTTTTYWGSGGVLVLGGTFNMNNGEISGNTAQREGGGVYVKGTFNMNGGKISGNTANDGGGVYVGGGWNLMNGGEISGNTANRNGGGMYVNPGSLDMKDGKISNNTAVNGGGGVYIESGGFWLIGGEISDNTANDGGGVYVLGSEYSGEFRQNGGKISRNTATQNGGGVYLKRTSAKQSVVEFLMYKGEISGNTAGSGGGMYVSTNGTLNLQNGTIYGSNANASLKNTASSGAALYKEPTATAQNGTRSSSGVWTSKSELATTNNTISY
ncbi:MAG: hypothetical protein LBI28_03300 [Treponema sp.]|jgi:hypothetical protein|nr:hypothetical protein [Treponema sp.]